MPPNTHHRSGEGCAKVTVKKAIKMAKALKLMGLFIASNHLLGCSDVTGICIA
jgi:hypothetical protein